MDFGFNFLYLVGPQAPMSSSSSSPSSSSSSTSLPQEVSTGQAPTWSTAAVSSRQPTRFSLRFGTRCPADVCKFWLAKAYGWPRFRSLSRVAGSFPMLGSFSGAAACCGVPDGSRRIFAGSCPLRALWAILS